MSRGSPTPGLNWVALQERLPVSEHASRASWLLAASPPAVRLFAVQAPRPSLPGTASSGAPTPPAPAEDPGYDEGAEAGLEQARARVEEILERYGRAIERLSALAVRATREQADLTVALALTVAREIIRRELTTDPNLIVQEVSRLIAEMGGERPVRVRLGPTDLAFLRMRAPEMTLDGVELVEDASLSLGGCVIEGKHRIVDASLEPTLEWIGERVRHVLEGVLTPPSEQGDSNEA